MKNPEKMIFNSSQLLQNGYNLRSIGVNIRKTVDNPAVLRYIIIVEIYLLFDFRRTADDKRNITLHGLYER